MLKRDAILVTIVVAATFAGLNRASGRAAQAPVQTPAATTNPLVAPSEAGTSAISGLAIDGTTGQPLAGVVVYLGPPQHGPPGEPVRQLTDSRGRFVFTRLPKYDGYFINASKLGYLEGHYGRASSGQLGARISVGEGKWVSDIRIVMNRPGSISGTVLDDHNEPIVGAFVRVLRQVPISGEMQMAAGHVAVTDDRGTYRIVSLVPGNYYVQMPSVQNAVPSATSAAVLSGLSTPSVANAEPAGRPITFPDPIVDADATNQLIIGRYPIPPRSVDGKPRVYPSTFFPAGSAIAGAATVTLGPGEERNSIDLRVAPLPGRRISGRIEGPPESSAGMTVRLMVPGTEDLGDGGEAGTALVDAEGRFTFVNIPAGAYVIIARDSIAEYQVSGVVGGVRALPRTPGIAVSGSGSYGVLSAPEGTTMSYRMRPKNGGFWARLPVNVEGEDLANLVLTPRKTGTIAGRYVFEGARGTSPGMVAVEPARGTASLGVARARANPADLDAFIIEGLMPGDYVLDSLRQVKSMVCAGQDFTYLPIDMSMGRDITDCVVTFTDKTIVVTGNVRDVRGQPMAEAGVIVFPVEKPQWTAFGLTPARIKSIQATNVGSFRFQSLPAGDYFFVAVPAAQVNAWLEPGFLELAAAQATRVHLDWDGVTSQDLQVKTIRWPR